MLDVALLIAAGLCQLALAYLGFRISIKPAKKGAKQFQLIAFGLIGFVGVVAIVWSGIRSASVQDTIKVGIDKLVAKSDGTNQTDDAKLYFQCDWTAMPKVMPLSGEIFVFEPLTPNPMPELIGANLGRLFAPVGSDVTWSTKDKPTPDYGHKCQLFNYGSGPVFDVALAFDVVVRQDIANDSGHIGGEIVQSGQWTVPIPKVDQGVSNPFVFYFFNPLWRYFIQIDPTPSATFIRSNEAERQTIKVISSTHQPIFLNPADPSP
jgi:hypothetical protein